MTLDEAIRRERRAMRQESGERSEEHRQVAEWLRTLREMLDGAWDVTLENCDLKAEVARYGELTRILDREWNIEVGWDGVRRVWNVTLTELGARLRDEREAVRMAHVETINELEDQNAELREIAAALWECCAWETDSEGWCDGCDYHDTEEGGCRLERALRELGIEVH